MLWMPSHSIHLRFRCDVKSQGHLSCTQEHGKQRTSDRIHHNVWGDLLEISRSGGEDCHEILEPKAQYH
jgi:hypothetical protein